MLKKKNDKEVNYTKLNELIHLSHIILKILFILLIIIGAYAGIILLKEVKILPFIFSIFKVLSPLFIGLIIAWLFDPIVTKLNKKGLKRIWGTSICYLVFIGIIVFIISSLIPVLSEQINDFVSTTIPTMYEGAKDMIDNALDKLKEVDSFDIKAIRTDIFGKLEIFATNITSSLPELLVNFISSLFSGIGVFAIGLIIGFYLLLDLDKNVDTLYSLLPKKYRGETKRFLLAINKPLRNFVNGALIDCTVVFVIFAVGFSIIGLKAPLLFALFCAIVNVIPYAGPYIGGIPAVVVAFSQSPTIGIAVLIFIVVTQLLEGNLFQPFIMSKTTKLSPVTIILGLLIFGHLFGMVGMVLSTPLIGAIKEIINFFDDKYDFLNFN